MGLTELVLISLGLSADAFAVAVTNGMCVKRKILINSVLCAVCFGLFQGAMPVIGYTLGMQFSGVIERTDHYIALILLSFIGIRMLFDDNNQNDTETQKLSLALLLTQGFATSIDALAVGVSFAALSTDIVLSAGVIAIITLVISFTGYLVGVKFGCILNRKAQLFGGLILIAIGVKIFIQHILF